MTISAPGADTVVPGALTATLTVAETRLEAVETALAFQLALADLERAHGVSQP